LTGSILLTAHLSSPLAGDPPQLDGLLEWSLSPFVESFQESQRQGVPHCRVDRRFPAPLQGVIDIPIRRVWLGEWFVSCCSNPILPIPSAETVDHVNKRLSVENSNLLSPSDRLVVTTTNSWTKSYRLPLRVRSVPCVKWFCSGNERNLKKALRDVKAIGKKVADGYGIVSSWTTTPVAEDYSWFARDGDRIILMRTLPLLLEGQRWLPENLEGYRPYFGACVPPYWHGDRFCEVVVPC